MATTAQFTAVRVVCNNTLAVAIDDSKGAVKRRHNTTFDADAVKRQLGISVSHWDTFMYRMKLLSERKVKHAEAEGFFRQLFTDPRQALAAKPNEHAMSKTLAIYDGRGRGAELGTPTIGWIQPGSVTERPSSSKRWIAHWRCWHEPEILFQNDGIRPGDFIAPGLMPFMGVKP